MALLPLSETFIGDVTTVSIVVDEQDTAEYGSAALSPQEAPRSSNYS